MHAYRLAFVPDRAMTLAAIERESKRLLSDPSIAARVQAMRDEAMAHTVITVREMAQDFYDIATADPNELISYVLECCRFCYGVEHRYQWVDETEYAVAYDRAAELATADKPAQYPDMVGGFGYHPANEPNMTCPCCFGRGQGNIIVHDTTKLSPKALKLYAGVKKTKDGLEVLMHDQMKARDALGRMMGIFKDGAVLPGLGASVVPDQTRITPEMNEKQAGQTYLQLVQGGKA